MNLSKLMAVFMAHLIVTMPFVFSFSMTNFQIEDVTQDSVRISWNTSEETTAKLKLGKSIGSLNLVYTNDLSTYHVFDVTGLDPYTYYYLNATSNLGGTQRTFMYEGPYNDPINFRTLYPSDLNPPNISDIIIENIGNTGTEISWKTNENANGTVFYSTDENNLSTITVKTSYRESQSTTIDTLENQRYYYKIRACDTDGNCAESTKKSFIAGLTAGMPDLDIEIPDKYGKESITFTGTTKPNSYIKLFVNDNWVSQKTSNSVGSFSFDSIPIRNYAPTMSVRFEITDQYAQVIEKSYNVALNFEKPILNVTEVNSTSITKSIELQGFVTPKCDVEFLVTNNLDQTPPGRVTGLNVTFIGTNSVKIKWDPSEADDWYEYAIYRNDVRLTTIKSTEFTDQGGLVGSDINYIYSVSAIDTSCNEGSKSLEVNAHTESGGHDSSSTPEPANLTCDQFFYSDNTQILGDFTKAVSLGEGDNHITVKATNEYANTVSFNTKVTVDSEKPILSNINIGNYNPSYTKEVKITGTVSEASTIYAYITNKDNHTPVASVSVDSANNFTIEVPLSRDPILKGDFRNIDDEQEMEGDLGDSWKNEIKIVAVDKIGQESEPVTGTIYYALCGLGSWFSVNFHDQTPSILNPRMMIEGYGQIGMGVEIKWMGGSGDASILDARVHQRAVSIDEESEWDKGIIRPSIIWANTENRTERNGYIQLKINALDPSRGGNWTMYEKEENISNHRMGECATKISGCVRYPLELEIVFEYNGEKQVQKTCLDVEAAIDKRMPPDYIPEEFLKSSIKFLNETIDAINVVLKPLETVNMVTMAACLGMMVADWAMIFSEMFACKFSATVAALTGNKFQIGEAQMGLCEKIHCADDSSSQNCMSCKKCESTIDKRKKFENYMQNVCDRIFCPSAPTFQKFAKDSREDIWIRELKNYEEDKIIGDLSKELKSFDRSDVSYDCALLRTDEINSYLVDNVQSTEDLTSSCSVLRVPSKECCKESYLERWDSACLNFDEFKESACLYAKFTDTPTKVGIGDDAVRCNVIWNSVAGFCEAKSGTEPDLVNTNYYIKSHCINDVHDFQNFATADRKLIFRVIGPQEEGSKEILVEAGYVTTNIEMSNDDTEISEGDPSLVNSKTVFVPLSKECSIFTEYFDISSDQNVNRDDGDRYNYQAFGTKIEEIACKNFVNVEYSQTRDIKQEVTLKEDEVKSKDAECKTKTGAEKETCLKELTELENSLNEMKSRSELGSTVTQTSSSTSQTCNQEVNYGDATEQAYIKDRHNKIVETLGLTDKEYVVDPTSSFLRSVQCVCLPAIYKYLDFYRSMLTAVKNCFQTLLVTGDGSAGICRAVISVYVCDLLYDMIRCFAEKFSWNGGRGAVESDQVFGNFVGAMTQATEKINNVVNNRYGKTNTFNAIFGQKKLAHEICMFAFTGTIDLDMTSFIKGEHSMPISSTGVIYPCERRFVSYNGQKNGISTWNYHIGVGLVAGSELSYSVKLKCSENRQCNPSEGFDNGWCDCLATGEELRAIPPSGQLRSGEVLDGEKAEIYQNIESDKRYDTALIEWSYKDNNDKTVTETAECEITQQGGEAPAFCGYDIITNSYKCGYNVLGDSWARFDSEPQPKYTNNQYFTVNEVPTFTVDVTSKFPQDEKENCNTNICSYSKFIKAKFYLENQLISESVPYQINLEGQQTLTIKAQKSIDRDMLSISSGLSNKGFSFNKEDTSPSGSVNGTSTLTTDQYIYVAYVEKNFYYGKFTEEQTNLKDGDDFSSITDSDKFDKVPANEDNGKTTITKDGLTFTFLNYGDFIYMVKYTHSSSNHCETDADAKLKAVFTIHDAIDVGTAYEFDPNQITYHDEEKQIKTVNADVRCENLGQASGTITDCPYPMYFDNWRNNAYPELNGKSVCQCGDGSICQDNVDLLKYCRNDSSCKYFPETISDCPSLMTSWDDVLVVSSTVPSTSVNRHCRCGDTTISEKDKQYCIDEEVKAKPECPTNKKATQLCICGTTECTKDQTCTGTACTS